MSMSNVGVDQHEMEECLAYLLGRFLPGPVIKHMSQDHPNLELWSNEIRTISCVCVSVGVRNSQYYR